MVFPSKLIRLSIFGVDLILVLRLASVAEPLHRISEPFHSIAVLLHNVAGPLHSVVRLEKKKPPDDRWSFFYISHYSLTYIEMPL